MLQRIVGARALATPAELYDDGDKALYTLARKVTESIDWWTPDRIWEFLGAIEAAEAVDNQLLPPMDLDLVVTNPYRMSDLLDASYWGRELGKAQSIRWAFSSFVDGMALVLPAIGQGGIEIMLWWLVRWN